MGQQQSKGELLYQQVRYGNAEGIKTLRKDGAGLEWTDREGKTPLILACMYAELYHVAKTLIELGANVNAYRPGCQAGTPLHHAAKRGLENTVKLLLSSGANPLVLNDGRQTPLEVARAKGYSNVVRAIESHICLFSGWMRELYGPGFLEVFAPQLLSRRVWVVILPTGSKNPTKPFKLELALYARPQDARPRTVMALWKANLEESGPHQSDSSVMIIDNSTIPSRRRQRRRACSSHGRHWPQTVRQTRLKLSPGNEGDGQQLRWFCDACKGIPLPMHPPAFLQSATNERPPNLDRCSIDQASSSTGPPPPPPPPPPEASASPQEPEPSAPPLEDGPIHYPSIDSSPVEVPVTLNGEKREGDGSSGLCAICLDAPSEAACVPCGHVAGCMSCLNEINFIN
ncbi:PREDICTED: putative E3 ubiquitin-protein ligase XBAT35 [Tarenaya hassleriana]|uniref:putative E3 ubiquitin-protein ligase XBAT35 n=1 Tax=Tarenaya hassleriana TaxID=28532 RepID=UPI00053CA349|nr:PREDICTED: putative E3 ubiquitin-protein ligase XBAT35 [Tarenaya hassleriana]